MSLRATPQKKSTIKLSKELERAILGGIIRGLIPIVAATQGELSREGSRIASAVKVLAEGGTPPPYTPEGITLSLRDALGFHDEDTERYLGYVLETEAGKEAAAVLQRVKEKQFLVEVVNEATSQLQGELNVSGLQGLIAGGGSIAAPIETVSERVRAGLPDPPSAFSLKSLPSLTRRAGGIIGVTAVGGEPGVGKSALAWQIALDVGRTYPVLYYDFENGFPSLMDRTRQIFDGNLERIRKYTERIYVRESIRGLEGDLAAVPAPALVIIDSIQKLPSSIEFRRTSLDRWVHRLEQLKKRGYYVLMISEVPRGLYDKGPYIGAFKETGEIEYSADLGLQLIGDPERSVELYIVKNRNRPYKGLVCTLKRVRNWVSVEVESTMEAEQTADDIVGRL